MIKIWPYIAAGLALFALVGLLYMNRLSHQLDDATASRDMYKAQSEQSQKYITKSEILKKENEQLSASYQELLEKVDDKDPGCQVMPVNFRNLVNGLSKSKGNKPASR